MGVTEELATFASTLQFERLPSPVVHEAKRSVLDWFGVALGGSHHQAVDIMESLLKQMGGNEAATVVGRGSRNSLLFAALLNGQMSHVLDFDDTHLTTITHFSSAVVPALLALGEANRVDGKELITAFVAGFEVGARVGLAVCPSHYGIGWHTTGTLGTIAATVGASRLLGLSPQWTAHAISAAATQAAGIREMFGSMSKALHPGKAAMNGLLSALLAQGGFTASLQGLEAPRGFAAVLSPSHDFARATAELGSRWEVVNNSHKPYACGVVAHPVIDAVIAVRNEAGLRPDDVDRIVVRVNPMVPELMGKQTPPVGLEGKFSVYHCAAVALIDGMAGPAQYTDARVTDPAVVAVRQRVAVQADASVREDEAGITVFTRDGRELARHIAHATGSAENPTSDAGLVAKYHSLADGILGEDASGRLADAVWRLDEMEDVGEMARLAAGSN